MMTESNPKPNIPWYQKTQSITAAILLLGPLALPMLWLNPRYKMTVKIIWTVVILGLTWALAKYTAVIFEHLMDQMADLKALSSP